MGADLGRGGRGPCRRCGMFRRRNPGFTGRDRLLVTVREALQAGTGR